MEKERYRKSKLDEIFEWNDFEGNKSFYLSGLDQGPIYGLYLPTSCHSEPVSHTVSLFTP